MSRRDSWLFTSVAEDLGLGATEKQIQVALRAELEPRTAGDSDTLTTRPRCVLSSLVFRHFLLCLILCISGEGLHEYQSLSVNSSQSVMYHCVFSFPQQQGLHLEELRSPTSPRLDWQ